MLRIVGGRWGGRRIQAPAGRHTRPTPERVREAVFSALASRLPLDATVVYDLYAGSGAMGIEALSRGARHVTFVEADARAAALIRRNLERLEAPPERWAVVRGRVAPWLRRTPLAGPQRVVILDPPYASEEAERALALLGAGDRLGPDDRVVLEAPAKRDVKPPAGLELEQARRYGDTQVVFLTKPATDAAFPPTDEGP